MEYFLREIASLWYRDRNPKDESTAELMRESSRMTDGIPRQLYLEAHQYRKVLRGSGN